MPRSRFTLIAGIAMVLTMAPLLTRTSPEARTVRRVQAQYRAAEAPILRPGSGTAEAEQFLRDLKSISTEGTPQEVQRAMAGMITAVEANLAVRRAGGDTNAANDRVAAAKRELVVQFDRKRGNLH